MIDSIHHVFNVCDSRNGRGARGIASLLSLALLAGCTFYLPPPATPEKVAPELPIRPPPPGEGEGQVLIDTTNGPARVSLLLSTTAVAATTSNGGYATGFAAQTRPQGDRIKSWIISIT